MPAATTHVEFAKDVYKTLSENEQKRITNLPMFYLGAQGPDLFFFSAFSIPKLSLQPKGAYMHRNKIEETIYALRFYASGNQDLESYVAGYLCHYILDASAHARICNSAKLYADTYHCPEGETHVTIEACIDTHLLKTKELSIENYKVDQEMRISLKDMKLLSDMYYHIFTNIFHWNISRKKIENSIHDILISTKFLRPNSYKKYQIVKSIESMLHVPHAVSGMMLFEKNLEDYLIHDKQHDYNEKEYLELNLFDQRYQDAINLAHHALTNPDMIDYNYDFLGQAIH